MGVEDGLIKLSYLKEVIASFRFDLSSSSVSTIKVPQ